MMRLLISGLSLSLLFAACKPSDSDSGYTTSSKGLKYQLITNTAANKAKVGDYVKYSSTLRTKNGDIIFSAAEPSKLLYAMVIEPNHDGDPSEVLTMLGEGDSASLLISEKEFFKNITSLPDKVKPGDLVKLDLKIHNIYTADQYNNEILPTIKAAPYLKEDQLIKEYINAHQWMFSRTQSGLYVVVDKPGTGKKPKAGDKVKVNYSGFLLDGTPFDSNVNPQFNHVQPFEFTLGTGQVIKGWDEGIPFFAKGGKGKLIIPSRLAYGEQGSGKIPPNSPLMFEVELLDIQ